MVFSVPLLNIDRLESPLMPPTSTGSRPSPATMASDAPDVVSVADTGHLVAHRNGRAVVRTLHGEGSELVVEVRAANGISVRPARVDLDPGAQFTLHLFSEPDGAQLPGRAASWTSAAPTVASVLDGVVRAGVEPGTTRVEAKYGGLSALAEVTVRAPPGWGLTVSPDRVRMAAGAVRMFQAFSTRGPVTARWESTNRKVLASLDAGLFEARGPGRAQACASAFGKKACSQVEVTP